MARARLLQQQAESLRDDAELMRQRAVLELLTALARATLAMADGPAGALQAQLGRNPTGVSTPLDGTKQPPKRDPAPPGMRRPPPRRARRARRSRAGC